MLKAFQEKYATLVENYCTAKEYLEKGLELFGSSSQDSFLTVLKKATESAHENLGSYKEFDERYSAALRTFDIRTRIEALCKEYGTTYGEFESDTQSVVSYLYATGSYRWLIHMMVEASYCGGNIEQSTADNFESVFEYVQEEARKEFEETCAKKGLNYEVCYRRMLSSVRHKEFIKEFDVVLDYVEKNRLRYAEYVKKYLAAMDKFASAYPVAKDINHNGTPLENIQQLQLLIQIHNLMVDTADITSAYEEAWPALHNFWDKEVKRELKSAASKLDDETLKRIDDECAQKRKSMLDDLRADLEKRKDTVIDKKMQKTLTKSFAKASKLLSKGKPYVKFVPWWNCGAFKRSALEAALTQKNYDAFVSYWLDSRANAALSSSALDDFRKQKEDEAKAALAEKLKDTVKAPSADKLAFVDDTFPKCYVLVGAALLDCQYELAYNNTFEEFTELPEALQTTAAVEKILGYFNMKRVDTVKEAINLYFTETREDERQAQILSAQERLARAQELSQQRKAMMDQKLYQDILAAQQNSRSEIAAAMDHLIALKREEIDKQSSHFAYLQSLLGD